MRLVAAETGDGRGVLPKREVGARNWMPFDGMIELMCSIKIQIKPGPHFLERNCGAPGESEGAGFAIHSHKVSDVACHADVLRRGVQLSGKITDVRRVAKSAVALFVGGMLDRVSGLGVTRKAELIRGRGKCDVRGAFDVGDGVADCAAHRNSSVDILPLGFVIMAFKTFGRINVSRERHWMLPKVGARG